MHWGLRMQRRPRMKWARWESNPHASRPQILSPLRLPVSPQALWVAAHRSQRRAGQLREALSGGSPGAVVAWELVAWDVVAWELVAWEVVAWATWMPTSRATIAAR